MLDVTEDTFLKLQIVRILHKKGKGLPLGRARVVACAWLFNPIVFNVSTRGNAEALVSARECSGLPSIHAHGVDLQEF